MAVSRTAMASEKAGSIEPISDPIDAARSSVALLSFWFFYSRIALRANPDCFFSLCTFWGFICRNDEWFRFCFIDITLSLDGDEGSCSFIASEALLSSDYWSLWYFC